MSCQSCNSCQHNTCTCNTCQGCNTCQKCNTGCNVTCNACQGCNTCQGTCDTSQAFCDIGKQDVGSFDFGACLSRGETIAITKSSWNSLHKYIYNAYAKGDKWNVIDNGSGAPACGSSSSDKFLYADSFNDVAEALSGLGSAGPGVGKMSKGDVIYGSYYQELEDAADGLLYDTRQCDACNTKCDVKCNECNVECEGCQGCNTCQKCNAGCDATCNSCQKCNSGCQGNSPTSCCDHTESSSSS